jgi:hypothetical protein
MWFRYSSAEGDILYVVQDARADVRAEGLGGYQLDPPAENILEKEGEIDEIVIALAIGMEFDQDVHVAFRLWGSVNE